MKRVDIAILGGGMVGLTVAVGLQRSGLKVLLLESQAAEPLVAAPALRVSALNLAAEQLLCHLGVWHQLVRKQPYTQMEVWERDEPAHLHLQASSLMQPHLGHIVENRALVAALWQQLGAGDVAVRQPCQIESIIPSAEGVLLQSVQEEPVLASLVIAADGAHSRLRQQLKIPMAEWDYGHSALVATIQTQEPHGGCARQLFTPEGPLALLPLWQPDLCSIVWSQSPQRIQQLQALPPEAFAQALTIASDGVLGRCELLSERAVLPLRARYARELLHQRCLLIGDAAHTIHPLAGQGVNLGLMDAAALIEQLRARQASGGDFESLAFLAPYVRWRKSEAVQMLAAMEGIKQMFAPAGGFHRWLRGTGIAAVDRLPPLKHALMRRAMGLSGELPTLARPDSMPVTGQN